MRRRNDAGARLPKMMFYVEGNLGFILDKEHQLARKQIQRHRVSLSAFSRWWVYRVKTAK